MGICCLWIVLLLAVSALLVSLLLLQDTGPELAQMAEFAEPISNVTVISGEDAVLSCAVNHLGPHVVAWVYYDHQRMLTNHTNVITLDRRFSIQHASNRWLLHISNVRELDSGRYVCQINTHPLKSQAGYLEVLVPPAILDRGSSSSVSRVPEGSDVSLSCHASGTPKPTIQWRRSDGNEGTTSWHGEILNISRISRHQRGHYLCIASNGVPPDANRTFQLDVEFAPEITISNPLVGAVPGSNVELQCFVELFPKSSHGWTTKFGTIRTDDDDYEMVTMDSGYWMIMTLTVRHVNCSDYGIYRCTAKNHMGEAEGLVTLLEMALGNSRKVCRDPSPAGNGVSRMQTSWDLLPIVLCLVMFLRS